MGSIRSTDIARFVGVLVVLLAAPSAASVAHAVHGTSPDMAGTLRDDVMFVPSRVQAATWDGDDFIMTFGMGAPRDFASVQAGGGDDTVISLFGAGISGGDGDDHIRGIWGGMSVSGDDGDDLIEGGRGVDDISGGFGDDVIYARDGNAEDINCGPGRDAVIADEVDRLSGCEITDLA